MSRNPEGGEIMKRVVLPLSLLLSSILVSSVLFAQETAPLKSYTWQDKLKRGAINIITSPVEVARDIHNTTEEKNLLVGWTIGLIQGLGEGLLRFGAGAIDLLTFPFNFPEGRKAPLLDPEYVWQKAGPKYI